MATAAPAAVRLALVVPGYDSLEDAELSDSLLAGAEWVERKGGSYLALEDPVQIDLLPDGCDPLAASQLATRREQADAPVAVVGDCGEDTPGVAASYAEHGLRFIMPFAQDASGAREPAPGVIQIEAGGKGAASAVASALSDAGRVLEGQVAVLTEDNAFATAFFRQLVAEGVCESGCRLQSVPWPREGAPLVPTEAQWVVYAGWNVNYLRSAARNSPPEQRWLVYNRGRTAAHEWLSFVNGAAYLEQDYTLAVPALPRPDLAPFDISTANALYFLAAVQVAVQSRQIPLRQPAADETAVARVETIIGIFDLGSAGDLSSRTALALHAPGNYLQQLLDTGGMIGALPSTAAPREEGSDPVYNLVISPLQDRSPLVLKSEAETTLTFSLGPALEANVLGDAPVNPAIEDLAEGRTLQLGVTLNCFVCAAESYQRRTIDYDPEQGQSVDPALFTIVPDPERTDPVTGRGLLLFTVDARGVDLDVIHVPVFVGTPTADQAENWNPPAVRPVRHGSIVDEDVPDLVIDVAAAANALPVTLIPHLPELRSALEERLGASRDGAWSYQSGVTKGDLDGLVRNAYVELRAMVEQHEALRRYFAGLGRDLDLSAGAARLDLSESDRAAMLDPLRRHGARIYDRVFIRGEPGLREGIRLVEEFTAPGGRPLRIVFRASNIYVPWQLLYPRKTGEVDMDRFWGFRHEMGTRQLVDAAQARLLTRMDKPTAEQTLFAAYRSDGSDEVAARAMMFAHKVDSLLAMDLNVVDSRDEFLERLDHEGHKLRLIIAYGHATSGTGIATPAGGQPILTAEAGGPRFAFTETEFLEPADIDDYTPPPDDGLLLEGQPVVLFNACETGGGGQRPMNNNGFVGALTRAGARAVIVTETPVWNNFAYHFGQHVFEGLVQGQPVRTALRDARLRHLHEWNNPLGLIYTLYGNPAARIE